MMGHRVVLADPPDIDAIWEWLDQNRIEPLITRVTNVSDLTVSWDVILEVVFATEQQATLFKITWGSR